MPQSLSRIYVHAIFSTKNRSELIDSDIEKELYRYIAKIFREYDSPCVIINRTLSDGLRPFRAQRCTLSFSQGVALSL